MKTNKSLLLILLLCGITFKSYSQVDSVKNYLLGVLDTMKVHSYNRNLIDWDKLYIETLESAKSAKDIPSLIPSIDQAVEKLKDLHSRFYAIPPNEEKQDLENIYATITYEEAGGIFPDINSRMVQGKYGYINFPSVGLENRSYADTILEKLKYLDSQNPEGWIIDLRTNDGGNFFPMFIGLIPFLDRDTTLAFSDADANLTYDFIHHNRLYTNGSRFARLANIDSVQAFELANRKKPIVVLVSEKTASSGEFSALTLLGQENVTLLGTKTGGLTSSNVLSKFSPCVHRFG